MDIVQYAAQLLSDNLGVDVDPATLSSSLSQLLGDGQGSIDLAGLASRIGSSGELSTLLSSWLGDGANSPISADSIMGILGESQVANFAADVGTDTGTAAAGLAEMIPQMMDKASSGGSLLDAAGGLDGLMGAARSFLR